MRPFFVLVLTLLLIPTAAIRSDPLRVVTEDFPPYNFKESGVAKGLSSEVVIATLKLAGVTAQIEFLPWARAYKTALNRPNTIIYSIARIPEREALFQWIGDIAPYRTSFYKLRANEGLRINSLSDARDLPVGVSLEDVILTYLEGEGFTNLVSANKDLLNIRKLLGGRIGLIAYDEASFAYAVRQEGYNPSLFERVFRLNDLSDQLYMAMSKNSDPVLVGKLRAALQSLKADGRFGRIHARYLVSG